MITTLWMMFMEAREQLDYFLWGHTLFRFRDDGPALLADYITACMMNAFRRVIDEDVRKALAESENVEQPTHVNPETGELEEYD